MSKTSITQDQPVPVKKAGTADLIGFGQDGVIILRNSFQKKTSFVIADYGYIKGNWRVEKHVRLVGDTTGNGLSDIVGFGEAGVLVSQNLGNNQFGPQKFAVADFAYGAGGWRVEKHIRYLADIRKTGRVDIVGFGDAGVLVGRNDGNGNFSPSRLALNDFGYTGGGWRLEKHLRFLADMNGNGYPDIVGFGETRVFVSYNNGDGTFQQAKAVINNFAYSGGGWRIEKHPRTVADLTGNGRGDIVGFGEAGVYVSFNNGNGSFTEPKLVVKNFGYSAGGWRVESHPRFIADVTGNGKGDIVGFGVAGIYISYNNGDGTFQDPKLVLENFGVKQGWSLNKHVRVPVDITGDGRADIVGFGDNSVWVSYNDGNGNFGAPERLVDEFGANQGWTNDKTVRYVANLF